MRRYQVAGLIGVLLVLAGLWIFPSVMFPNPGANDAPILWTAPMPIVGLTLLGSLAAVIVDRVKGKSATASIALGTYMVGVAVVFLISLVTFANLSNDRYWPFLLTPVVFVPAGIALILIGLVGRSVSSSEIARGLGVAVAATVFLLVWMLARGSRDWLLAPYGFDICLLISLEAAIVFLVGGWRRLPREVGLS